ncbi:MAG: CoA transferase, partial [Chloroflexi bacterium]|nr:CoA transferase [Chloroflexota bacterium]
MAQALDGIRVLDLCHNGPGLFAGAILGDMGAEVIHIQDPRSLAERGGGDEGSAYARNNADRRHPAYALNRNKRGLAINLKSEGGRELFYRLADVADVVLDGYRPGVMKRLGFDYETLSQRNPRIVCCSISGFGQNGPYRNVVGHDLNYVSNAGGIAITGQRGGAPQLPGFQFADFAGGTMHAVSGILFALLARERTGRGQYV